MVPFLHPMKSRPLDASHAKDKTAERSCNSFVDPRLFKVPNLHKASRGSACKEPFCWRERQDIDCAGFGVNGENVLVVRHRIVDIDEPEC
jgi:hypothetical protein